MQQQTIKLFIRYALRYRGRLIVALVAPIGAVIFSGFLGPLLLANLINQLQHGTVTLASTSGLVMLYALTQLLGEVVLWRFVLWATWSMETRGQRDLYTDVFRALSHQSSTFHADRFSGSLVSQTTKLTGAFERFWDMIIWQTLPMLTTIIGAAIILGSMFWQYAVFITVVTILFTVAAYVGARFLEGRNTLEAQRSSRLSGFLADMIGNILAVKAYGNEATEHKAARRVSNAWLDSSLSVMRGVLGLTSVYSTLLALLTTGTLLLAIFASEHHVISIGAVYLMLTYTLNVGRQLWELNSIMRNYSRIMGDSHDMVEILNEPFRVHDESSRTLVVRRGAINFDDVTFSHHADKLNPLFAHFTLTIRPGERIGLVGHSGSGKTTLTNLLLRFMDVDSGVISIDGQSIRKVSQKSLRRTIAYVPQEPLLFHRSLSENIAYGKSDATQQEIIAAAKKANAHEFIEQLSEKYDTLVGERGVKLSGGQRQRVTIARAILKDAPILVLDEATSALDSESEKLIQDSLASLMKDRTSIVIAHRLSTIAKLDRIIVLDNGRIVEDGAHEALLAKNGTYARLWAHQSGGFIK